MDRPIQLANSNQIKESSRMANSKQIKAPSRISTIPIPYKQYSDSL